MVGRRTEGGGYGSVITAMGLMDVWGLKLALDDSGGLTVFLSVIGRFPPITQSLSLSLSIPLLFLPIAVAAIYF